MFLHQLYTIRDMLEAAQNHSTMCQIKSFIPVENIHVEKLRFAKINAIKSSQVCLA